MGCGIPEQLFMAFQVVEVDSLIIGAGVIGSSVAMHLAEHSVRSGGSIAAGEIRCLDFDLDGALSSSELNAGGVRATWNQPINIRMSQLTIDYFAQNAEAVGYHSCGYLWLQTPEKLPAALKARERQIAMGWPVEAWDLSELRRRVPFIDKTQDLAGAVFGPRDGLVNPNRVKNHFREKARAAGARFDDRTLVREVRYENDGSLRVICDRFPVVLETEQKIEALSDRPIAGVQVERVEYHAQRVVNCAGPWAGAVAKVLGYSSPAFSQRRQICIFDCRDVNLTKYGMIIDTSGVYFHPEATNGLAGWANHDEPHGVNYAYDGDSFFMEHIWPALYERSTAFEKLKHVTGWAGLYEVSPDESAILGQVEIGEPARAGVRGRVFEAHSFSGHGVMHSHSAGLAIAELMLQGKYSTLDVSELSATRFQVGREVRETAII
jgi:glycine/D-amino acid oxidase-like deaminating enzyme